MTRARALKQIIRERASKTGERYTTARRHVLKALAPRGVTAPQATPPSDAPRKPVRPAGRTARPAMSDAKFVERTGHHLDYWFDILDRFGAVNKGHTATARFLHDTHNVDGWYAQSITVSYERARGVRQVNQRLDGAYEVSVSKTIPRDVRPIVDAISSPRRRKEWGRHVDPALIRALDAALERPASKGFVIRPDGLGRYRYHWDESTVQFYLTAKNGKTSVVVTNAKLKDAEMVDERRGVWRAALAALAMYLK